jgi:hypothetical protein
MKTPITSIRRIALGATAAALLAVVAGCAATASPDGALQAAPVAATAAPSPPPAVPAYTADGAADALSASVAALVPVLDGFAPPETRAGIEGALAQLDADRSAAAADPASAPPSGAPGGWNQQIALDASAVRSALEGARPHVVGTAIRVLNEETVGAEQPVRDAVYLAVVEQQNTPAATDDTPRLLTELIAKTRAAQVSQAAYLEAEAARAAEAAAAPEYSGGSEGGTGDGSGNTGLRQVPLLSQEEWEERFRERFNEWREANPLETADPAPAPVE